MQKKKESQEYYNKQVKLLCKNFRFLDQHYIRLLFEFCEFEAVRAYKVLEILKDWQVSVAFIKKLVDFPNDSDQLIAGMENQYHKKYGDGPIELFQDQNQLDEGSFKNKDINVLDFDFFMNVPRDVCGIIFSYLDPFSFSKLAQTCMKFYLISKSQMIQYYFKDLCLKVFKNEEPVLPTVCRFSQVRQYVQAHPIEYGPNITNAVMNNLRYYVWKSEPKSFRVDKVYYKSFGNYRNLFLQAPRINFNGFYVCRHKYVKVGEKGFTHTITPLHVIYYYRYIRFFQDGSLLCCISSNKIKKEALSKLLSKENLQNFDPNNTQQLKIGEYMQFKNTLYVKIVKSNTIFNYEMQINSTPGKISDQLIVLSYTLELVDDKEIVQNLYNYKPYKEKLLFSYLRNELMEEENSIQVQATSL